MISTQFNRFYHSAVLTELFKKCGTLKFRLWIDDETGGVFEFVKGEHFDDMDDLKQLLKNMNLDYAVNKDEKISTAKIGSKALIQHIEWCIGLAGENNITFSFIEEEWQRLLRSCGIEK
jgi:hypothetical protein